MAAAAGARAQGAFNDAARPAVGSEIELYPIIKCNMARRSGEKVYHPPFDEQYDKERIEPNRGEFFAMTVSAAERAGFRRAWR